MKNILEFLEQSSQKYFTKIAFSDDKNEITYGQCVENAQRIGTNLLSLQAKRQPIAVMMDKNIESLTAFFGVVYSGNFYVVIDIHMPDDRIQSIFETLHRDFPATIEYANKRKVFIVSPSTLWATLNTIRAVLSDIKIKRVADKIKKELDYLLTDLSRLNDRAYKVQQHFSLATKDIEDLQISINKITPRAEKIKEMDFGDQE